MPRWLKLDRAALEKSGGVSIYLDDGPRIDSVADRIAAHPWAAVSAPRMLAKP
ncbi:hypothetical protein SH584_00340 [Sphingomonas sp. LY29]|uniref:hypothetical protein n=1 Tax=Sphingomonas sp. LY29 TaxID=3095341 RepID=UPI002D77C2E6|nr:hypothetical protein [Sphingomonas sp. LY29]WRP25936.1 hypothetical protein SH584_00340 [Sphingomonas sp. LY29]